jgi:antitoxin MazE
MQATIGKWGNSRGIRLPKALLEIANLAENDTVEITAEENSLTLTKVETRRKTIQERFEGFEGEYDAVTIDWGDPVGGEVW